MITNKKGTEAIKIPKFRAKWRLEKIHTQISLYSFDNFMVLYFSLVYLQTIIFKKYKEESYFWCIFFFPSVWLLFFFF